MWNVVNDTVNEHVYTVNKRVSIREATGVMGRALKGKECHTPCRRDAYLLSLCLEPVGG